MERADVVVVGAGIIGLATAWEVLRRQPGSHVVVLEKEAETALHQSTHNSGVIHAGVYYKPGSLKASLCVRGSRLMLDFCREHDLPSHQGGKLVVAVDEDERPRLEELYRRTQANGLEGVRRLGAHEIAEVEPFATGIAAIHVPSTGAAHYPSVARTLADLVVAAGGECRTGVEVDAVDVEGGLGVFRTTAGETLRAARGIVCAGLQADRLARGIPGADELRVVPFRGGYYDLRPDATRLVRSLIYPVPDPAFPFLGVHFTRHADGTVSVGPNAVPAFAREHYRRWSFQPRDVASSFGYPGTWRLYHRYWRMGVREISNDLLRRRYLRTAQRYVPDLRDEDMVPGQVGIRAQVVQRDGTLVDDFSFLERGPVLHVMNAPSPAATASLAIAEVLADRLLGPAGGG